MVSLLIFAGLAVFGAQRLLRFLQFFQQEQYWATRFLRWMKISGTYERIFTGSTLLLALIIWLLPSATLFFVIAWILSLATRLWFEGDPRKKGKITLKMTSRARRIYLLAIGINSAVILFLVYTLAPLQVLIAGSLLFSLAPLVLITADVLLKPYEKSIQNIYINEAKRKLTEIDPLIIGITGSYGKTSVKTMLGEAMNTALGPTFFPQKGYNSKMGITREIREKLSPATKYAVIEMGAYAIGSIKRLCELTPPRAAIVTAVGLMHVESFGSAENVYRAKSELPEAVPVNGLLVLNGDNAGSRKMATDFSDRAIVLYGLDPSLGKLDCVASDLRITGEETVFSIAWKGVEYSAKTIQLGRPAVSNFLACFACLCSLGGDPEIVISALSTIPPASNRLEAKKQGGVLYLNDAYNSNPVGFASALEVLGQITASRKVLMTPGMIELGDRQYAENKACGALAAKVCTDAIIVSTANREALTAGLFEGGMPPDHIKIVDNRAEAFKALQNLLSAGDAVLIENDLPDLYESEVSL